MSAFKRSNLWAIPLLLTLSACGSDDDDEDSTDAGDLAVPGAVNCVDSDQCLAVTATWCAPGADPCANNDVDLSLVLPSLGTVGIRSGENRMLNGCAHAGDEQAEAPFDRNGDGDTGPFSENIACNPTIGPTAISPGEYMVQVSNGFSVVETGSIIVDIFIDGSNQRQIVNVDDGSTAEIVITYP